MRASAKKFFNEITESYPAFISLLPPNKFIFLMKSEDEIVLCKLSKFVYESFNIRENNGVVVQTN